MCIENLVWPLKNPSGVLLKQPLKEFLNIHSIINFYTKAFKCFPEKQFYDFNILIFWILLSLVILYFLEILILIECNKNVNFRQIFNIILVNDDSFLQMYRSVIFSFSFPSASEFIFPFFVSTKKKLYIF